TRPHSSMRRRHGVWRWAWVVGAWSLLTIPAVATGRDTPDASVVQLRLSVDALSSQLRAEREQTQARLAALQEERDTLGRQLRAARLRSQTLDRIEREWAAQEAAHDEEAQ